LVIFPLVGSVIFLSLQSGFFSWQQTAWVLFFNEIVKPQKFEEVPAGEVEPSV
jgi:hypothetical protein